MKSQEIEKIKEYVRSLNTPDNEVYQDNKLLIDSCFAKAIDLIESLSPHQEVVSDEDANNLESLALWFDRHDAGRGEMVNMEVQEDLRRIASFLRSQSEPSKAIEFAEWMLERGVKKWSDSMWEIRTNFNISMTNGNSEYFTTQELYDIFTNQPTRQEKV